MPRRTFLRSLAAIAATATLLLAAAPAVSQESRPLTIQAAASLTDALTDAAARYRAETGLEVRLNFGGSSALAKQIEAGAPADLFASADLAWMAYLAERDLILADSQVAPFGNRLVLIAPRGTAAPTGEITLAALLPDAAARLATGETESVPVGRYARAALESLDLWAPVAPRIVGTADVRQALSLVARGEAARGLVYATDAAAEAGVLVVATFPADSHPPIVYPFAAVRGGDEAGARAFLRWLETPAGLAAFQSRGFTRPGS